MRQCHERRAHGRLLRDTHVRLSMRVFWLVDSLSPGFPAPSMGLARPMFIKNAMGGQRTVGLARHNMLNQRGIST